MNKRIIPILLVVFLITTACGFTINLPEPRTPEPTVTDEIQVDVPSSGEARLTLNFGAGELHLEPGAQDLLVDGTAEYNYSQIKPIIKTNGNEVSISAGEGKFETFPNFQDLTNRWDFKLGSIPTNLTIESGAYTGDFEFGGLSLTGLTIKDGASSVTAKFSKPNKSEMSILRYETGASTVKLIGLGNANFSTLDFSSGAGDYTLDFTGELKRSATATIDSGLCNITLIIPEGVHAVVTVDGGVTEVTTGSGWSQSGDTYTQEGDGPTLTIVINIGAGSLTLTK